MLGMKKILSALLAVAVYTTFSLTAVAFDGRAGEVSISGMQDGVSINGSAARSGRAIAPGSTIVTGPNSSATISVDGLGTLKVAPNSSFTVDFDATSLAGSLERGEVSVLESETSVNVTGRGGESFDLSAGETASVGEKSQAHDDGSSFASKYWWLWLVIIGGAVTGVVIAASGSDSPVSPNR